MEVIDTQVKTAPLKAEALDKLLGLTEALLSGDYSKRIISDFDDDVLTKIANNLNRFFDQTQLNSIVSVDSPDQTINSFIDVISSFANLDFRQKLSISQNGTILDAIATGINVLGEELEQTAASKKELEAERNRLAEAQAIAKVGSWELEFPSFRLVWSCEAYRIFEIDQKPADLLYEAYRKKIHPEDLDKGDYFIKNAIDDGADFAVEFRVICENNTVKHILCLGETIKNGLGKLVGLKGTIQDITERKLVEVKLKEAREYAEDANEAKSRFLANMSHEIRTPLNAILGLTEIMIGEGVNESNQKYLELISSSGKNLKKLINDILDFSKIESGKLQLEAITFNFSEAINSSINPYKFLAKQKGLTLLCHIDGSIPNQVIGDPTCVSQIMSNLISNAIKFTDEGTIEVTLSLLGRKGDEAVIQGIVADTGIGVPQGKKHLIFQSFTQADETVARKYGGTGLGLSIVKNLLEQMKGSITVQSPADLVLNRGSAFTFSMKLKLATARHTHVTPEASTPQGKLTFKKLVHILIVDDNKINLLVAKKMVKKFGANVTTAENGLDAIQLVKVNEYDMVLMDIQMPGLDGYETTIELRKMNFLNPILALSANAYKADILKSQSSGMNDHIQKPYTEQQLFEGINKFFEL